MWMQQALRALFFEKVIVLWSKKMFFYFGFCHHKPCCCNSYLSTMGVVDSLWTVDRRTANIKGKSGNV